MFVVDCGGSGMFGCGGVMMKMMMRSRASMSTMIVDDRENYIDIVSIGSTPDQSIQYFSGQMARLSAIR